MTMKENNLTFHPISIADREWMQEKLDEDNLAACEYTFANNYIWRRVYQVEVGQIEDCGVIRYRDNGMYQYSFPFGNGRKKEAIRLLWKKCAEQGQKLCLYPVEEEDRQELIRWFPGRFAIRADRDAFDYVYTAEKLSTLKGKKLHGKRNHIARFMDEKDWSYEALSAENMEECRRMAKEWISLRSEKWNEEMEEEMGVLEEALSQFDVLRLVGGVLRKKGKIVAFTIGERLNSDTMVVHFEKAYPDLQGAYPMINQQFILHEGQQYTYINREDDTGDPGLRKAKLSYYPDILLKKYIAIESHVVFANEYDIEQIKVIWRACFGDSDDYISLYMNNRFTQENMMVIHADGMPVSMAGFLPVTITMNGQKQSARYVYAVATLPEYRGRGYAAEILRYAAEMYQEPLILQPAQEMGLKEYYGGIGFREAFIRQEQQFTAQGVTRCADSLALDKEAKDSIGTWQIESPTPEEYKQIRDTRFEGEGYCEWDADAIRYAFLENELCGGKAVKLIRDCREEILLYRVESGQLRIVETTLEADALREVLAELLMRTGAEQAYIKNTGGMLLLPTGKKWTCDNGYLNLTLG